MAHAIREVWAPNLEAEMQILREVMEDYPYIAMDTEFPGVVARPIGNWKTQSDYHYQTMRCNVDLLKIIQVGITLADEDGRSPPDCSTWQFNFKFSIGEDMYAPESIELLSKSGIDFSRHEDIGIIPNEFAELLITSGLVLSEDAKWVSFHSGYDFGFFMKLLTDEELPNDEEGFFELLDIWFPRVYDVRVMLKATKIRRNGLQELADEIGVTRIGPSHQAGSDSLLTASTFFKLRDTYFHKTIDDAEYSGKLFGFGQTSNTSNGITETERRGVTIAEREDRTILPPRTQTPVNGSGAGTPNGGMMMGSGMGTPMGGTPYPMANAQYMRSGMLGR